jgi:hypothetical protein
MAAEQLTVLHLLAEADQEEADAGKEAGEIVADGQEQQKPSATQPKASALAAAGAAKPTGGLSSTGDGNAGTGPQGVPHGNSHAATNTGAVGAVTQLLGRRLPIGYSPTIARWPPKLPPADAGAGVVPKVTGAEVVPKVGQGSSMARVPLAKSRAAGYATGRIDAPATSVLNKREHGDAFKPQVGFGCGFTPPPPPPPRDTASSRYTGGNAQVYRSTRRRPTWYGPPLVPGPGLIASGAQAAVTADRRSAEGNRPMPVPVPGNFTGVATWSPGASPVRHSTCACQRRLTVPCCTSLHPFAHWTCTELCATSETSKVRALGSAIGDS